MIFSISAKTNDLKTARSKSAETPPVNYNNNRGPSEKGKKWIYTRVFLEASNILLYLWLGMKIQWLEIGGQRSTMPSSTSYRSLMFAAGNQLLYAIPNDHDPRL